MPNQIIDQSRLTTAIAEAFGDSVREPIPALLGHPLTNEVEVSIDIAGHPGLVYIHGLSNPIPESEQSDDDPQSWTTAFITPNKIPPGMLIAGTPILVQRRGNDYYVVDLNGILAIEYLFGLKERVQRSIDVSQMDYGLLRPTAPASMRVVVTRARYNFNDTIYDVPAIESIDLSDYVYNTPSIIRIDVDPVTKTLSYLTNLAIGVDNDAHQNLFAQHYQKTVDIGKFVAGWVKLYNGINAIIASDIYNGQEFFSKTTTLTLETSLGKAMTIGGEVLVMNGQIVWTE